MAADQVVRCPGFAKLIRGIARVYIAQGQDFTIKEVILHLTDHLCARCIRHGAEVFGDGHLAVAIKYVLEADPAGWLMWEDVVDTTVWQAN